MSKINISLNNKIYSIDESVLASAADELKAHLSNVMSGTGATINLGGTTYNIDSTKLTAATNDFVSHLGTIAGEGEKITVGGVEISIDSTKISSAFDSFNAALNDLAANSSLEAGLYVDGVMTKSWEELLNEGAVTVEDNVITGGNYGMLVGELVISDTITEIGARAFVDVYKMTGVIIPDSVTSLGDDAFYGCSGLINIVIGKGITVIPANAFNGCYWFESIVIPSNIINIGYRAFMDCEECRNIVFEGTMAQWNSITFGDEWNENVPATHIHCTDGDVAL